MNMEMSDRSASPNSERSRWPALATTMGSTEITHSGMKTLTLGQKIDRWYGALCFLFFFLLFSLRFPVPSEARNLPDVMVL